MSITTETGAAKIQRLVGDKVRANADLLAYFGAPAIIEAEYEDFEGALNSPLLAVLRGSENPKRVGGGSPIDLEVKIGVAAFLPRAAPARLDVTIPSAPTVAAASGSGALTGSYSYCITRLHGTLGSCAESYASPVTTVSLSGKNATITLPALSTGDYGWRIWRGPAGLTSCRWVGTSIGAATSYTDSLPDSRLGDDLAPIRGFSTRLRDHLMAILYGFETLDDEGFPTADAALTVKPADERVLPKHNLRLVGCEATFRTQQNESDSSIALGSLV